MLHCLSRQRQPSRSKTSTIYPPHDNILRPDRILWWSWVVQDPRYRKFENSPKKVNRRNLASRRITKTSNRRRNMCNNFATFICLKRKILLKPPSPIFVIWEHQSCLRALPAACCNTLGSNSMYLSFNWALSLKLLAIIIFLKYYRRKSSRRALGEWIVIG